MSDLARALDELLAFEKDHQRIHGDIKRTSIKYGVSYDSLQKRWCRIHHKSDNSYARAYKGIKKAVGQETRSYPANHKSDINKPSGFDAHGRLFYSTLILNDDYITKLPEVKRNRWGTPFWFGIRHADFTLMAYPNGRLDVFPKPAIDWRSSLEAELLRVWDARAVSSVLKCLQMNGSELELAIAIPGVAPGQHYTDKSKLVDIDTDQTPKHRNAANVEVRVHIGQFDKRLTAMEKSIHNIPTQLGGGMHFVTTLSNMMAVIGKHAERIYSLEKLSVVNGLNEVSAPSLNTVISGSSDHNSGEWSRSHGIEPEKEGSLKRDDASLKAGISHPNNGSPSKGAPREAVSSASPAESAGVLSDHSTPVFLSDNKSQLAIQLSVTKAPDTGEPFCEKASPKTDPTVNEMLALDLGLAFKEGYQTTSPPQASLEVERRPKNPPPEHCPYLQQGYGGAMLCLSNHTVYSEGAWKKPEFERSCFVAGAWDHCTFFKAYRRMEGIP
jgi:hypothetical protein